jgi:hypothetical protein
MPRLLLISILIATLAIPMRAARHPDPVRGVRRAILWAALFNALYAFAILYVYPRLF